MVNIKAGTYYDSVGRETYLNNSPINKIAYKGWVIDTQSQANTVSATTVNGPTRTLTVNHLNNSIDDLKKAVEVMRNQIDRINEYLGLYEQVVTDEDAQPQTQAPLPDDYGVW